MTIHAAKGLEFGVVCVADLGRRVPADTDDLLVADGQVGLRLVGLDGSSERALAYPALRERAMAAASAEESRIAYVALTRAQDRLIVSGSLPVAKWPDATAQTAPPIAWLAPALVPGIDAGDRGGAGPRGRVDDARGRGAARPRDGRARPGRSARRCAGPRPPARPRTCP